MRKYYALIMLLIVTLSTYAVTIPTRNSFHLTVESLNNYNVHLFEDSNLHGLARYVSFNYLAPTVICQDITVYLDATGNISIAEDAVDNGSTGLGALTFDTDITNFDCSDIGPNTVTLTVTDNSDSISDTCTATVTVVDNINPSFTGTLANPSGPSICGTTIIKYNATGTCQNVLYWDVIPGRSDNCGVVLQTYNLSGATTFTSPATGINHTAGTSFNVGVTTVAYYIEDASGNSTTCTFDIEVRDNQNPVALCQNLSVQLDPSLGTASITPAQIDNGSYDNCGNITLSLSQTNFDCSEIGSNNVILTVEDDSGRTSSCNATVTVTEINYNPSVLISASATTICQGTSVTFTATPTDGGPSPSYQWYVEGVPQGGATNSTFTTSSLVNGDSVTVEMTSDLSACATPVTSNTINMTVNPPRPVSFNINSSATAICPGESVTFNHGAITNGGTSPDYQWLINGNPAATTSSFSTSSLSAGDVVTLEVTSYVSCATPVPATSTNSITITVHPLPMLSTVPGNVCANSQTSIDLNTLVTTNGTTVTFHTSQSNADNDTGNISATVSPNSDTTYYVRSELATGCYVTDTILISVDPLPTVNAGADQNICLGESFDLSTISSGSGTLTYHSSQANANNGTNAISSNVSPGTTTTYYVRSEDGITGCYNTDFIIVTVNALPTLTTSNGSVCANGQTSINLNTLVTTNGTSLTFHANQSDADNDIGAISATVSPTSNTTYYVRSENAAGCYTTDTITITIDALPTLSTTDGEVCASGQTSYDLNSSITTSGTNVTFHTSQANADNDTGAISATISPTTNTTYYVRSENVAGCYVTDTIDITVNALPNVVANASATTICIGDSVTLTGSGASSYTWNNGVTDDVSFSPSSTQTYTVTGYDANGCYNTASITVTVNPNATLSLNGSNNNQNICVNSSITNIVYTVGGGATGATVTGLPSGLSGNYSAGTFTISGTATTSGTFNYIVSTAGCGLATATGTIRVFSGVPSQPSTITGDSALCPPVSGLIYSVTNDPNVLSYNWTVPSGFTITSGQGTNQITVNSGASSSSGSIQVVATNPCGSSTARSLTIFVGNYAYANAGPDQVVCEGTTQVTLAGATGGVINSQNEWDWSDNGAGGIFNSPNSLNSTYLLPAGATAGDVITITIDTVDPRGSCSAVSDNMTITVIANPTASISGTNTICTGSASDITFTATPNTTVTYNVNGGSNQTIAVGGTGTASLSTGPLSATTTYNLVSVQFSSSPSCTVPASGSVVVTVNPIALVDAGTDLTVCAGSSINLSGSVTGGTSSGIWSAPSGSFGNNSQLNTSYTPSIPSGTVVLTLTSADPDGTGPCGQVTDTVTITVNPIAVVDAGANQTVCAGSSINLNGSVTGGTSSGTWSAPSGSFGNNTQLNTSYTPSIPSGTIVLTLTSADPDGAGPCGQVTDTVTITVNPIAVVDAGTNQTVCAGGSINLSGSVTGGTSSGTWSAPSGSFGNNTQLNTSYTPSIPSGTVVLTLTSADPDGAGPCGQVTDTVTITVNPIAVVDAGANQTVCAGSSINLNGSVTGGTSSGTWSAPSGSFGNNTQLNTSYTPSIPSGTVVLTLTSADPDGAGPCGQVTDTVTITVKQGPIITTQPENVGVCVTNPASLSVVAYGDDLTYQWYYGTAPGTMLSNGGNISGATSSTLNFSQAYLSNAGIYYVVVSGNGACSPAISDEVTVNVNQIMNIDTQPAATQTLCEGSTVSFVISASGSISSYQWYKENGATDITLSNGGDITGVTTNQLQINNIDPSDAGQYYVVITGPGGTCPSVTSTLASLTVNAYPTVDAGSNQTICSSGTATMNAVIGGSASTGIWTTSGSGNFNNNSTSAIYTPSAADITAGTVTLTFTTSNAASPCPNVNDSMVLTINPIPVVDAGGPDDICQSSSPSPVTLSGATISGGASTAAWSITSGGGTLSSTAQTSNPQNITYTPASGFSGTVTLTLTSNNPAGPCNAVSDTRTLNISNEALVNAGPDQTICSNSTVNLAATLSGSATSGTWSTNGSGTFNNANSAGAIYTPSATDISNGSVTLTFTTNDPVGACPSVSDSLVITLDPVTVGGTVTGEAIGPDGTLTNSSVILVCQETGGTLTLSGHTGSIVQWEYSTNNGATWNVINNTSTSISYSTITDTTLYRVRINSGTCGFTYSSVAIISVVPNDLKPTPVTVSDYVLCLGESSTFSALSQFANGQYDTGGQFNTGQLNQGNDPQGWLVDGSTGGWTANGNNSNPPHDWSGTNDHYDNNSCVGQIDSGDKKFALADGIIPGGTQLETPVFNTFGLESATFEFDYFWNLPNINDQFLIEVSVDGGATYESTPLLNITGPNNNSGNPNPFSANHMVINLATYPGVNLIGIPNIRIRLTYIGNTSCSGVYLDNIELPAPPIDDVLVWSDGNSGNVLSYETSIQVTPPTPGVHNYAVTAYLVNSCGYEITPENSEFIELTVYDSDVANAGPDINIAASDCGTNMVTLAAAELTAVTPVPDPNNANNTINLVSTGTWSVISGQDASTYSFSDLHDPESTFTGVPGQTYTLQWNVVGPTGSPCPPSNDTMTVTLPACATLDFDGINDNVTFRNHYDFSGPFTIEVWVKSEATTGSIQTIYSKRNGANITGNGGYDLRLVNNLLSFRWNGSTLNASHPIATDRWYHTAITFDGGTYRLYVDGILVGTGAGIAPNNNNYEFLLGAMDQAAAGGNPNPVNYFNGWLDEMRIWNVALNDRQLRHMMNQQILANGGNVRGEIVPIDIPGLTWNNLTAYYRMNQPGDISGGYLIPTAGTGAFDGQLRNITTWQEETAPLPYLTRSTGSWNDTSASTPWLYGDSVWDYPNSTGINGDPIDWNIVRISHNVTSQDQDVTVLGLLVDATRELTITSPGTQDETNPGTGLWVTHYLDLDGIIDLIGESQLVQKRYTSAQVNESILDANSSGYLERDQQGTSNLYNYNYWSSPVSAVNPSTNNAPYNIGGVLRDGTNSANPQNISWTGSYNATGAVPIGISRRWLYAFRNNISNTYSEWAYLAETGTLNPGLGYTMKGSGVGNPVSDVQNYVYIGKPHNGTITNPISSGNEVLAGNPYPSAIDANEFIYDNIPGGNQGTSGSIDGTLYFWVHYLSNNTHVLRDYEGGYAVRNLAGGLAPVTPPPTTDGYEVSGNGSSSLVPGQYVPVGQGFFVGALTTSGGQIKFENDQRIFKTEQNPSESIFLKQGKNGQTSGRDQNDNPNNKSLRFAVSMPDGAARTLLLAFIENGNATDGVDYGYDALNYDNFPNDISFMIQGGKYVIQGVGAFNASAQYPLGVFLDDSGNINIELTEINNFDDPIDVYIYDATLGTYTSINESSFETNLDAGDYLNRFYVVFTPDTTLSTIDAQAQEVMINYLNSSEEIYIKTPSSINVKQVYLINMLGQTVKAWNYTNNPFSNEIKLPVKNIAQGGYIVKVETDTNNTITKKIIIK